MPDWVMDMISPLCALGGVALGAFLSGRNAAKNLKEQEQRENLRKIYTAATVDIEKIRISRTLIFDSAYIKLLDSHFALIKLFASKEVEDAFKSFGSYIHSFQQEYFKFCHENNPVDSTDNWDEDDPAYQYLIEDFHAKINHYKKETCPTLEDIDVRIKPLQSAMRKDLGSDNERK